MNFVTGGASAPDMTRDLAAERTRIGTTLLQNFASAGYGRIEPPILQEAATFLELGGEDIRARLYLTSDGSGTELCLRPEYTIPACRLYLDAAPGREPAAYSYCGPVFRLASRGPGEVLQAGLESFGRTDTAAADAEVISLALDAARGVGASALTVAVGDAGLVARFLDAIDLPPLWQRRLRRGLEKGKSLEDILGNAPQAVGDMSGVLAALAGTDGKGARALVTDLLSIAGIATVGGRSVGEIAERFLNQVAQQGTPSFGAERRALLGRFLAIKGDPDAASAAIRALAREAEIDLEEALDLLDERTGFMLAQGLDVTALSFSTAFARNLDYYTGFVFEVRADQTPGGEVLAGGGRYDRLAQALGSERPVPAVGAAIWIERLVAARSAA